MPLPTDKDTIVAVATPLGSGAIAVIRMSGTEALSIGDRVFRGSQQIATAPGYTVHFGQVVDRGGETLDEVLATVFRQPHSYTGEDGVEFSCHGGTYVTNRVLTALVDAGARLADPGEFTKRAFLNGKMDLSKAEAIADLIAAQSQRAFALSMEQLQGRLAGRVEDLRREMIDLCSLLEVNLDFSEEGIDLVGGEEIDRRLQTLDRALEEMASSFSYGKICKEGLSVVLAGSPNAGKSSLFNALLMENRAIVTPVPGTTRDTLEENVIIDGILFRLIDTAGLRESNDIVEIEGVNRTKSNLRRGDIVLFVVDASETDGGETEPAQLQELLPRQQLLVAYNKSDLLKGEKQDFRKIPRLRDDMVELLISARTGAGLKQLRNSLVAMVTGPKGISETGLFLTNKRHLDAVNRARESLLSAQKSRSSGGTSEFIAFDVREAAEALSEITGEVTSEEILNNIFGKFCIGK